MTDRDACNHLNMATKEITKRSVNTPRPDLEPELVLTRKSLVEQEELLPGSSLALGAPAISCFGVRRLA